MIAKRFLIAHPHNTRTVGKTPGIPSVGTVLVAGCSANFFFEIGFLEH